MVRLPARPHPRRQARSPVVRLPARPHPRRQPLSVVHARALYRPVPPVEFDDDGYPGPDGRMSESTTHDEWLSYGATVARGLLPDALVGADLAFLFENGNPTAVVSPDLMVVPGAGSTTGTPTSCGRRGSCRRSRSKRCRRGGGARNCGSSRACTGISASASSGSSIRSACSRRRSSATVCAAPSTSGYPPRLRAAYRATY